MSLFLALIVGFWNKSPKLKAMRTGRCGCNHWCFENHLECPLNTEVWNSFLILSCLSALMPMADSHATQTLQEIQSALHDTEHLFRRSDAHMYTPYNENMTGCTNKFIDCYLLEMNVLLHEENFTDQSLIRIKRYKTKYMEYKCFEKYPCELQELTNSTVFYQRMKAFLQKLTAECVKNSYVPTCD
ncbi:interleukin-15 isoform X1 [Xyrauchen texanus]|uniref:interleukin-15 isoform X1 n=1 Tax=Xyrauchen texanus TaxID=154827 RepID=UPI0022420E02|nr:interleukin-15 isoform X1 [Xyrauchen texanus]